MVEVDQALAKGSKSLLERKWPFVTLKNKQISLPPLFVAAVAGQCELVQSFIANGAYVRSESEDGRDLFFWASLCPSLKKRQEVLHFLFDKGFHTLIDKRLCEVHKDVALGKATYPSDNDYPLDCASISVLSGTPHQVFGSRFSLDLSDSISLSDLKVYRVAVRQFLSNAGISSAFFDCELYIITILGDLEALKQYSKEEIMAVCQVNDALPTLIEYAVRCERFAIFEYLTKECNVRLDGLLGTRCAYMAAACGDVYMLRHLKETWKTDLLGPIGYGAFRGETPLYAAARYGNIEVLKELVDHEGADPLQPIAEGKTLGHTIAYITAALGYTDLVRELSQRGIRFDQALEDGPEAGRTPASAAAMNNCWEVLEELGKQGVDLTKPIENGIDAGVTPAMHAVICNGIQSVKVLFNLGVDFSKPVKAKKFRNHPPIYIAAKKGYSDILLFLKEQGVNLWMCTQTSSGLHSNVLSGYSFPGLFEVFGIKPPLHRLAVQLALHRACLHLACLAGSYEGTDEFLENGFSVSQGVDLMRYGEPMTPLDALLTEDAQPSYGPPSEKEKEQARVIQLLIKRGLDREETLQKVRKCRPRLYSELLTDVERSLEEILAKKSLLQRVLVGTLVPPKERQGLIILTRNSTNYAIKPSAAAGELESSIYSLLSKEALSETFSSRLKRKLLQMLSIETSPFSACKTEMTSEELRLFCCLFEKIETVSHSLASKQFWSPEGGKMPSLRVAWEDASTTDFEYVDSAEVGQLGASSMATRSSVTSDNGRKNIRKKKSHVPR